MSRRLCQSRPTATRRGRSLRLARPTLESAGAWEDEVWLPTRRGQPPCRRPTKVSGSARHRSRQHRDRSPRYLARRQAPRVPSDPKRRSVECWGSCWSRSSTARGSRRLPQAPVPIGPVVMERSRPPSKPHRVEGRLFGLGRRVRMGSASRPPRPCEPCDSPRWSSRESRCGTWRRPQLRSSRS